MEKIKIKSTSNSSADAEDIILRETKTSRLIFRPMLVKNEHNPDASVKGTFIYQRKTPSDKWEDKTDLNLSNLKADEWIKLELKSAEVLDLFNTLTDFYSIYQQEGIPSGEAQFLKTDDGLGALLKANENEFNELLNRESNNASVLLSRLLQWFSNTSAPGQVIEKLEDVNISGLQQLNSLVGLASLKSSYQTWEDNIENSNEKFWQNTLTEYSFVLSQIFAKPVIVVQKEAYVGGKKVDNSGGGLLDFLARNEVSKNAVLIEIKTPTSLILGKHYRGNIFNVSKDLSGALIQTANYKHTLQRNYAMVKDQSATEKEFETFEPACVIVTGNFAKELKTYDQRKSFELFRSHLSGVEIITFDELFGKVKLLIDLLEGKPTNENLMDDEYPF